MTIRLITTPILLGLVVLLCAETWAAGPIRKWLAPQGGPPTSSRSSGGKTRMPGARLAQGSKKALAGTREKLMFWDRKEKRSSNAFIEGTGRFFRPDLVRKENERKKFSFVRPASWFEAEPESGPGPRSIHDWIGQPRPGFNDR